ncbi:GNAT family N-acetyltransferase [Szabonella alba]|uniref:GNAT family N-acetyltransferase n=1 Tax=Szabonella alba TaxID=2804194 RepID=A0A8K0VAH1_9RHOB|nr:GNAT family N-acetyltransferase [Szabonella alba]MBL4917391.1 GNAT family N-acetyltransferase [Szabonella alba]
MTGSGEISVRTLTGSALEAALDDVAVLRIAVFRDWPYLYDGSLDYERRYMESYRNSAGAIVVGAFDGARLVGAATGTPMEDHAGEFAAAFAPMGIALQDIFYCAESVLMPQYRSRGIGHRFFDEREAHAAALGRRHVAFCSVLRPDDHPMRPKGARSNDAFWRKRGYAPLPGVMAEFSWTDLGKAAETKKLLQFWMRTL